MNFRSSTLIARIGGLMLSLAAASVGAQAPDPDAAHSMQTQDTAQMQQELSTLRDQVRQLEQRMQFAVPSAMQQGGKMGLMKAQNAPSMAQVAKPAMPMGGMRKMDDDDDTEMPMKDTKSGSSKSMPSGGMGMEMNMMKMMEMMRPKMSDGAMMGMGAMGGANSPAAMA